MNQRFTDTEFRDARPDERLPLECGHCHDIFYLTKKEIGVGLNPHHHTKYNFCSRACSSRHQYQGHQIQVSCEQCGTTIWKSLSQVSKSKHNFCSCSCAAKYHNSRKQTGTRRSKLEKWLGEQLVQRHPDLEWHFNQTDAIEAELDIYIPTLKLAFELNGIFHYEPIYGADKLDRTHQNDHRKLLACAEHGIELCVIDTSKMIHFKEKGALMFLQVIEEIIAQAVSRR